FTIGALFAYISQPIERKASLEFRLLFRGSDSGKYPNGLPFNPNEIISTPIVGDVYAANDLKRYCSLEEFKNGFFIIQSGTQLQLLDFEYQAKLADARLTPVERSKLEDEFKEKHAALNSPQYTLNFINS